MHDDTLFFGPDLAEVAWSEPCGAGATWRLGGSDLAEGEPCAPAANAEAEEEGWEERRDVRC